MKGGVKGAALLGGAVAADGGAVGLISWREEPE